MSFIFSIINYIVEVIFKKVIGHGADKAWNSKQKIWGEIKSFKSFWAVIIGVIGVVVITIIIGWSLMPKSPKKGMEVFTENFSDNQNSWELTPSEEMDIKISYGYLYLYVKNLKYEIKTIDILKNKRYINIDTCNTRFTIGLQLKRYKTEPSFSIILGADKAGINLNSLSFKSNKFHFLQYQDGRGKGVTKDGDWIDESLLDLENYLTLRLESINDKTILYIDDIKAHEMDRIETFGNYYGFSAPKYSLLVVDYINFEII